MTIWHLLILLILVMWVGLLIISGIPQDAYWAYTKTRKGDRLRLYRYYQTARHHGVPLALEQYGVRPKKN